jgi:hypothetical protein
MNFLRNALVLASFSALSVTAMAKDVKPVKLAKATPNCEVKGKKQHVKDEAACTKKKGKWLEAGVAPAAAVTPPPAAAPAPVDTATPAAAPTEAPKK